MSVRRLPAEWEPQSGIQLTFPHRHGDWAADYDRVLACYLDLTRQLTRFVPVLVVCDDVAATARLLDDCPADRLRLVALPTNDTWARDHGAITVLENGQPLLLDYMFNGWGLKFAADQDNQLTQRLHAAGIFGSVPRQVPGLVLEGGSIESDGAGTLLTTAACLLSPNRNAHLGPADLEQKLRADLGIDRCLWLHHGELEGDDTDAHVDTLARFCDPHTIAYVHCDDPADPHYPALQAMKGELETFRTAAGAPYRLVPLPMVPPIRAEDGHRLPATYANFLITNGAVLAPTYGQPTDAQALAALAAVFSGREVVGVDCQALIRQHGSLHCATMQFPLGVLA